MRCSPSGAPTSPPSPLRASSSWWRCPGTQFRLRRPLSLHSVDGERLRLLVEPRGEGTRELTELGVADTLALAGPLGSGFPLERVRAALLVGGGIGTAPFQFVVDALRAAVCR